MSYINRSELRGGEVYSLIPLHPDTILWHQDKTGKLYISGTIFFGPENAMNFNKVPQENFFWANYRTLDSVTPCSPVKYAAETIGLDITARQHGARVFRNDATPPIAVTIPKPLDEKGLLNYAKMWKAGGSGGNYGMPRFLDNGADIKRLSMSNEDAQYIETRRYQKEDICGIYRVPPHLIGDTTKAKGWSTLENQDQEFLKYTLNPYLTNIEKAIMRSLIPEKDWNTVFADFDTKMFMRANIAQRIKFYEGLYKMNAMSSEEIRQAEGMNPMAEELNNINTGVKSNAG